MYNPRKRIIIVFGFLLLFSFALAACAEEEPVEVTRVVEVPGPEVEVEVPGPEVEVEVTRIVEQIVEVAAEPEGPDFVVPFAEQWATVGSVRPR